MIGVNLLVGQEGRLDQSNEKCRFEGITAARHRYTFVWQSKKGNKVVLDHRADKLLIFDPDVLWDTTDDLKPSCKVFVCWLRQHNE